MWDGQILAKMNFESISKYHGGAVFLTLSSLVDQRTISLAHMKPIRIGRQSENNKFSRNADELIRKLFVFDWSEK